MVSVSIIGSPVSVRRTVESLRRAPCETPFHTTIYESPAAVPLRPLAGTDHVLLQAGTEVFPGWLDRLAAAAADPGVASVIPFSNSGDLGCYPVVGQPFDEAELGLDWAALDQHAAQVNAGRWIDVPVPSGCCVYRPQSSSAPVSLGEQPDSAPVQIRHRLAADVCVHFLGAEAGLPEWARPAPLPFMEQAAVECFLRADPARFLRRRLDLQRLAGHGPALLVVSDGDDTTAARGGRRDSSSLPLDGVLRLTVLGGQEVRLVRGDGVATPNLTFDLGQEYFSFCECLRSLALRSVRIDSCQTYPAALFSVFKDLGVRYADADRSPPVSVPSDLPVPSARPILFRLVSADSPAPAARAA